MQHPELLKQVTQYGWKFVETYPTETGDVDMYEVADAVLHVGYDLIPSKLRGWSVYTKSPDLLISEGSDKQSLLLFLSKKGQ